MLKIVIGTNPTFKKIPNDLVKQVLEKVNKDLMSDLSAGVRMKAFNFEASIKSKTKILKVEVAVRWEFGAFNDTFEFNQDEN